MLFGDAGWFTLALVELSLDYCLLNFARIEFRCSGYFGFLSWMLWEIYDLDELLGLNMGESA